MHLTNNRKRKLLNGWTPVAQMSPTSTRIDLSQFRESTGHTFTLSREPYPAAASSLQEGSRKVHSSDLVFWYQHTHHHHCLGDFTTKYLK